MTNEVKGNRGKDEESAPNRENAPFLPQDQNFVTGSLQSARGSA
jgi:hypothetical protein